MGYATRNEGAGLGRIKRKIGLRVPPRTRSENRLRAKSFRGYEPILIHAESSFFIVGVS